MDGILHHIRSAASWISEAIGLCTAASPKVIRSSFISDFYLCKEGAS